MKRAFTLVELLVVIGILAVLTGILLATIGGTTDSARAAKCLANMKNLAAAVQSRAAATGYYPYAGSIVRMNIDTSRGKRNARLTYNEGSGWISWASEGQFPSESAATAASISMIETDERLGLYAITNGALWKYVNGNKSVYVCPLQAKRQQGLRWSYLMNAYFGWSAAENYAYSSRHHGFEYSSLAGTDRRLLFAEIPFQGAGDWFPLDAGSSSTTETDAILQYEGCKKSPMVAGKGARDGNEHIGANHKSGRDWYAHVVFADGHTEKLRCSNGSRNLGSDDLRKLTTWLCTGKAVTFNGSEYEELD